MGNKRNIYKKANGLPIISVENELSNTDGFEEIVNQKIKRK